MISFLLFDRFHAIINQQESSKADARNRKLKRPKMSDEKGQ